ncbi:MAG: hypothetical protein HY725_13120 [Candidatus Rokubacteria bacterium]|nr:hypothetical protein [Candidatus Rokubacteria bacterium]
MRTAFLVKRANFYRLYAPVVDEALRQGWEVECWHDYSQPRKGQKGYNFPAVESVPSFVHGKPRFRRYYGSRELRGLLQQNSTDAVVSLTPPSSELGDEFRPSSAKWLMLQHALSNFIAYGCEGFLSSDGVGLYSDYWTELVLEYFREKQLIPAGDQTERKIEKKALAVGFPEMEASRLVDPGEVRHRLGIPGDKPVVVFLPYSYGFGLSSFRATHPDQERSRWDQLSYILRQCWTDLNVVKAVRAFCDRNGAHLIVKARLKRPTPIYTKALADTHLYDESVYPATILEVLSIASLCIGFYSTTVHEAAYLGIPYLCIRPTDKDVRGDRALQRIFMDRTHCSFDFPGVSVVLEVPEVIQRLPRESLAEFRMDAQARAAYVERFLGCDDGRSSTRVLEEIRRLKH